MRQCSTTISRYRYESTRIRTFRHQISTVSGRSLSRYLSEQTTQPERRQPEKTGFFGWFGGKLRNESPSTRKFLSLQDANPTNRVIAKGLVLTLHAGGAVAAQDTPTMDPARAASVGKENGQADTVAPDAGATLCRLFPSDRAPRPSG